MLRRPVDYVLSGNWPNAELGESLPAEFAQIFARNLSLMTAGNSLRDIGRRAQLSPQTIQFLQLGETWPDMVSVVKLEIVFRTILWPSDRERRLAILTSLRSELVDEVEATRSRLEAFSDSVDLLWDDFFKLHPTEIPKPT